MTGYALPNDFAAIEMSAIARIIYVTVSELRACRTDFHTDKGMVVPEGLCWYLRFTDGWHKQEYGAQNSVNDEGQSVYPHVLFSLSGAGNPRRLSAHPASVKFG